MQMKKYVFHRALNAGDFTPDTEDSNVLTFSCASSKPYIRYDKHQKPYAEILEISEEAINFERLQDGNAPFLWQHDPDVQIGVVERAFIQDGKLYVTIRFSKNPFPQEVKEDIISGIRRGISIGYSVDDFIMVKNEGYEEPAMIVKRFTPYEISSVSCAADISVGIGRSKEIENVEAELESIETAPEATRSVQNEEKPEDNKIPTEEKSCESGESEDKSENEQNETAAESAEEAPEEKACGEDEEATKELDPEDEEDKSGEKVDLSAEEAKARLAEIEEIRSLGELTNQRELAEKIINENLGLVDFKTKLENLKTDKLNVKEIESTTMKNNFNLLEALNATDSKSGEVYEVNCELKKAFDMPLNTPSYCFDLRALSTDDAALRPAEYKQELYTDLLYPESVVGKTNATVINFNRPQRAIKFAVQLSGAAATFVGLNAPVPSGDMGWTEKLYEPHKVGSYVNIPFLSYLEDQPDIQSIVTDDMLKNIYMAIDYSAITGSGTDNAPTGIINDANVNVVDPSGIYSLTGAMQFEKKIRDSNDFSNDLTWVMNNTDYYTFATTPYYATEQNRMLLENGKLLGHNVVICNGLSTGNVILGNFSQLLILNFHPVTLELDTRGDGASLSQSRRYIVYAAIDVCVRRPKSFTVSRSA